MTRFDPAAPVLCAGRRTAIGTSGHAFAGVDVIGLAAPVLAAVARAVAPLDRPIDDVVIGNCMGPGGDIARVAALAAGLGDEVPGVTVDRQCGSGLDAVLQAAARVRAGDAELVLAGGAESASTAPWRFWPGAPDAEPVRYTRAPFTPALDPQESGYGHFDRVCAAVRQIAGGPDRSIDAPPRAVPTLITCGAIEENRFNNEAMVAALQAQGYPVSFRLVPDAHTMIGWRDAWYPALDELVAARR